MTDSSCVMMMGKQMMHSEAIISTLVFWLPDMPGSRLTPAYSVRMKIKLARMNSCPMK